MRAIRGCAHAPPDRGTMPVTRSALSQTSIERKVHGYLAAHAAKTCERFLRWRTWRVLVVTTHNRRIEAMAAAVRSIDAAKGANPALFLFARRDELRSSDLLTHRWNDADGASATIALSLRMVAASFLTQARR